MKLLFHAWNHSELGRRSLEDIIRIVVLQLRECGHWAMWDPDNDRVRADRILFAHGPDEYNVIVEGFTPEITRLVATQHAMGARFICLATEEPTDGGFNHGTQKEMVARQEEFAATARYLDGILHLVPGERVTQWYSQFAPTAQTELGYASALLRPSLQEPHYDFGFFGSMTPRRLSLLKRLTQRVGTQKAVRVVMDFATGVDRDAAMQEAKVILQVRKFDEMGLVSSCRCNTALCLGRPVVAEPHDAELSKPWDEIVRFSRTDEEFIDLAILTSRRWRETHAAQFGRFKAALTPEVCIGTPLRSLRLGDARKAA